MKWLINVLVLLLIITNGYWLYGALDQGVMLSYRDQQVYELEETRKQLMAVMPKVARNLTKEEVVTMASEHTDQEVFEKEGCTWVGWIGLKFSEKGSLLSVSPSWSYGGEDPCYPNF
ncbi:MAG: hypothetical protein N0E54_18850 [Candidatus Thiodiazotropha taylori]|nr:hypothetical protein [Candidatus Thiodiazotropha endolucinida]MCW4230808.1 hypothetical protein [Candidatus Thiodiazotropha taylori]